MRVKVALTLCAALMVSCGKKESASLTLDDPIGFDVVVPQTALPGLDMAAQDLVEAFAQIRGVTPQPGEHTPRELGQADASRVVMVTILAQPDAAIGEQGYKLKQRDFGQGRAGVEVQAATPVGAMYGLYDLAGRLGARYYHPERTFYPTNAALELPTIATEEVQSPRFTTRGFHEHTQHPIIMSDALMVTGNDALRGYASNYLKWLARNRQNASSFHLLKTVNLEAWRPYISDIVAQGQGYGVKMGVTLSFADQQQNNFRLIGEESQTGSMDVPTQIRGGLDNLLAAGFDFVTMQIGTSEFTKPTDEEALGWIDTAYKHLQAEHEGVELLTWIHPPCDLEADGEGLFFHLPLQSDPGVGALVHTTMFYTVEHPAPVYGCEDFRHQQEFMREADGKRRQVFYPETAWWLGFDNNMPLTLPVTGWSRAYDIQQVLSNHDVEGHITFTTGREWLYWQYDHYLTQVTWDASIGWDDYLRWIGPMYGEGGEAVASALSTWTEAQVEDFYELDPLIYFYLAGELVQDEVGEQAGVLARRPKLSYDRVLAMDDAAFEAWTRDDLDRLRAMSARYQPALDQLEAAAPAQINDRWQELLAAHRLYVMRIAHAVALYEGVSALRPWIVERRAAIAQSREPDEAIREAAREAVTEKLMAARAISAQALEAIQATEATYRYPLEWLAKPKPNSLTSYKIGYLEETSRAYFWTRRDDQLGRLIDRSFDMSNDAWTRDPGALYLTSGRQTRLSVPADPLAAAAFRSFVPRLLFGLTQDGAELALQIGEDFNENLLPDEGTEQEVRGERTGDVWRGEREVLTMRVRSSSGDLIGTLEIEQAELSLSFEAVTNVLKTGELQGEFDPERLVDTITEIAGIDRDGASNLVKGAYKLPVEEPLPARLPVHFLFNFTPAL